MLIVADARRLPLRDGSVQAAVTSPPYWGLRDYGQANQIGLEATPEAYVCSLRAVFAEVWLVLRDDGTMFLNLGDSYVSSPRGNAPGDARPLGANSQRNGRSNADKQLSPNRTRLDGLKPKDLVGIPWRVAFALQADGWYLRSDIIWHKPNPMPESVTDRPTMAHEHIFLLAKSERYYYDADAISEVCACGDGQRVVNVDTPKNRRMGLKPTREYGHKLEGGRNKRNVWTIATMPYSGAHFATMPEALVELCILAGCPIGGLVFDPFIGSGTVGAVAERLGRRWIGTDLSYQPLARARTAQRGIRW